MTFTLNRTTITGITQANPAVVTTTPGHGMLTGMVARLVIPLNYGMIPLSGAIVHVNVISPTTFSCYASLAPSAITINSTNFPAFVTPTNPGPVASCIPIGEGAQQINDVPWQTENGYCDSPPELPELNNSTVEIPF